jgi:hypothetical protein
MAVVSSMPSEVEVRCGWLDRRPKSVRLGGMTLPVLLIARVREEAAAYPALTGPRTCYEVVTRIARLRLAFRHRERRWVLERYEPRTIVGARAA